MEISKNIKVYPLSGSEIPYNGDWSKRPLTVSQSVADLLPQINDFEVREDDIWLITMAKCGTTWSQEMTWLIMNNYDFDKAREVHAMKRVPFLEYSGINPQYPGDSIKESTELPSPRLIKSHLPLPFLPKQLWTKKPKIIYVSRNPMDASISLYHFMKAKGDISIDMSIGKFVNEYVQGNVTYLPYWEHILEFWQIRNEGNILFTSYERMKQDLGAIIKEVCLFLGKTINDDQMEKLKEYLSFDNMRNNPSCNRHDLVAKLIKKTGQDTGFKFMRRGIVGSFKDELSTSDMEKFEEWSKKYLSDYNVTLEELFGLNI